MRSDVNRGLWLAGAVLLWALAAPAAPSTNAHQRLLAVVQQLATLATVPPATGRCHLLEGNLDAADRKDRPVQGDFRIAIGPAGKFMARVKSPQIGEFAAGQGRFPWVELPENKVPIVFAGTKSPLAGSNVFSFVDPQQKAKWQLAAGIAVTLPLAPDLLLRHAAAEFENGDPAGVLTVTARDEKKIPGGLSITFQKDGVTPKEAGFELGGLRGNLYLRTCQIGTIGPDALFEPSEKPPRREVSQKELLADIGALLNYAGDQVRIGPPPPAAAETAHERLKPKEFLNTYITP